MCISTATHSGEPTEPWKSHGVSIHNRIDGPAAETRVSVVVCLWMRAFVFLCIYRP